MTGRFLLEYLLEMEPEELENRVVCIASGTHAGELLAINISPEKISRDLANENIVLHN